MSINVKDIAHDVARDNPTLGDKAALEQAISSAFGVILERVAKGEEVHIHRFGSFKASLFKGRTLNSPLMKDGTVTFADQLVLRFHQAPVAKRRINELASALPAAKQGKSEKPKKARASAAADKGKGKRSKKKAEA